MTKATVPILFTWIVLRPDQRTYRQNAVELEPSIAGANSHVRVQIDVPRQAEYIANLEALSTAEVTTGAKVPDPILTPAGVRWITDQFDDVFYRTEEKEVKEASSEDGWGDDSKTTSTEDDWGDTSSTWPEETVSQPTNGAAADEWAEETKSNDKDEPWNEAKEDWGN